MKIDVQILGAIEKGRVYALTIPDEPYLSVETAEAVAEQLTELQEATGATFVLLGDHIDMKEVPPTLARALTEAGFIKSEENTPT